MFGTNLFSNAESSITSFISRTTNAIAVSLGCPSLSMIGLSFSNIYRLLKKNEDIVSTELKQFSLQTSTYNKIIPEVFGRIRIAGNIMWVSEIKKTSIYHSRKITKYGTQNAYTEYTVRGSFAIAICNGVVDEIKNIYANNEPLNLSSYNIKIYYGDEKQKQDPTMQSYLGADIPAFKGLCYVVFTDFPMEEFNGTIPNFTFDVVRNKELQEKYDMENLVSCINIIPGSGEFVYDTKVQKKLNGGYIYGKFYETEKPTIINKHNSSQYTDAVESLNDLQKTFPNLKWVSLVVCWFCDDLNCKQASIYPACENNNANTEPDEWNVAGQTRKTAKLVGTDSEGNIRYGGTPSDECVKRYVKEIKKRGLKVCIYPMVMVDVDKKPWRGHITCNSNDINNFFTKQSGYNNFIKHYATLLKDDIDAIIIGSEMIGLTSVFDEENNTYPAVDEFCNLASEIKNIVNSNTKITYTADWSEYHHNNRGDYNLDKLWANENIDFIGIDAYFPLTDKDETTYDIEEIKNGWRNGEGYDFYYKDGNRTEKLKLEKQWAWKNIEWFWNNYHYDKNGNKTEWIPKSKKIWFMEYGFQSVDCCTNQPNVFYSKDSIDSSFPRCSHGNIDFKAQRTAIVATEMVWANSECVENKFLYTWDARPYPCFPNLKGVWADAYCWKYGHFLNGKAGYSTLGNIIKYICKKVGLNDDEFDVSLIKDDIIDGFLIDGNNTMLYYLRMLANTFNFDAYIDGGRIIFKSLKDTQIHTIDEEELIINEENNKIDFTTETICEQNLPNEVELLFMNIENDYKQTTAIAKDNCLKKQIHKVSVEIPMSISQAHEVAWNILSNLKNQNILYKFNLPIKYAYISPLDVLSIDYNNEKHLIRVKNIKVIDLTHIQIVGFSITTNDNILTNLEYTNEDITLNKDLTNNLNSDIDKTEFDVFELPNITNEKQNNIFSIYIPIWSNSENWQGASIYYSIDNEQNYEPLKYINKETSIGKLVKISNFNPISSNYIDECSEIYITLLNENQKLQSITDAEFLNLKNIILIGDEIIAFRDVEIIDKNVFKISHLLRGRYSTENAINNHQVNEKVILLDNDLCKIDLPITMIDKNIFVKVISKNDTLLNNDAKIIKPQGKSLMDFDVKDISVNTKKNKDIFIKFAPRKNYKISSNINNIEILNKFLLTIKYKQQIKTFKIENTNNFLYSKEEQIKDFGEIINQKNISLTIDNILLI